MIRRRKSIAIVLGFLAACLAIPTALPAAAQTAEKPAAQTAEKPAAQTAEKPAAQTAEKPAAPAAEQKKAQSLDDLLKAVAGARAAQAQANAAREKEFIANRAKQIELLAEAKRNREAARVHSEQLSAQFDANELMLGELEDQLSVRLGSLGELFGVVRQVSGDVYSAIYNSMISAEYPGRDDFLADLSKRKDLPTIEVLEKLSYEMLREMVESGRVSRFSANVAQEGGAASEIEVVRTGPFIAMSGGDFLVFSPKLQALKSLPRQPGSELTDLALKLQEAREGYVEAPLDPSRGTLLEMYVQRPNVMERIEKGELVGYVIITVGVIGAIMALYQFFYLLSVRSRVKNQLKNLGAPTADNPLGRVLQSYKGDIANIEEDAEIVELHISEAVLREVPLLERFQAFLRLAVAAGPLLGLVGTVIGMIITFQSITESGSSDPRLMADGIGQAMIATVLGLGIAIPLLFMNAGLVSLSKGIVQTLDEQSTGLLAEAFERTLK